MEVILKKTKVSASILKQTLRSTEDDLRTSEVLGWCIFEKVKYIVLYNPINMGLSKILMLQDVSVETKNINNTYLFVVTIKFGGNWVSHIHHFNTKDEADTFVGVLKTVKSTAESKGQFFL